MKITVVCDAPGVENAGMTVAAATLIRAMQAGGHEVIAVCQDEEQQGKEGYAVMPRLIKGPRKQNVKKQLETLIWDSDAVYMMCPLPLGRAALRLCLVHRIPVIAAFSPPAQLSDSRCRRLYRGFYRYADAVHYPDDAARESLEAAAGCATRGFVFSLSADSCDGNAAEAVDALLYAARG